jgi:hypothetical protein
MSCCNERDCRPVAYRISPETGREKINATALGTPSRRAMGRVVVVGLDIVKSVFQVHRVDRDGT